MTPPAMIFAAGFGTRMGELTRVTPKPMLPLGGRPMIDHTIGLLRDVGISRIVANTHYCPEDLEDHLERQNITTLREDPILETGGGLRAALPHLGGNPILTMNPDALWSGPNPVEKLLEAWKEDMTALLVLVPESGGKAGDFSLESGRIRRNGPYRYTGLQLLRTDWLSEVKEVAFSLNLYWDLLMSRGPVHGYIHDGDWMDIGTPQGLESANRKLAG